LQFGGAVWYPLLHHLVFVGLMAYRRSSSVENLIWGMLHDAHECVTNDIPRPFKCDCMRKEQSAIDQRLLNKYFVPYHAAGIDFDLIKQCDVDACDIEAVELQLPNYAEITTACAVNGDKAYHHELYKSEADLYTIRGIRRRRPFANDTTSASSKAVTTLAYVLTQAKHGAYSEVIKEVRSWNLI
jgi:hypothetical protein